MRYEVRACGARGVRYLFRVIGDRAYKVHRPMSEWALYLVDAETSDGASSHLCWRCWRSIVRVFGVPCQPCGEILRREYYRRRAANGGRLLFLDGYDPAPNVAAGRHDGAGAGDALPGRRVVHAWTDAPGDGSDGGGACVCVAGAREGERMGDRNRGRADA